jgi:prepilin-type N-terminal cleavage/methylation domain-containing protein
MRSGFTPLETKNRKYLLTRQKRVRFLTGFTLVELLIVLAIGGIIAGAIGPAINHFSSGSQLDDVAGDLKQTIQLARERAVAGVASPADGGASSPHGVFLELNTSAPDRYILFRGANYATRDPLYDQATAIRGAVNLTATLIGNTTEISFTPRWGMPNATGTITLTHSTGGKRVLRLNDLGFITTE